VIRGLPSNPGFLQLKEVGVQPIVKERDSDFLHFFQSFKRIPVCVYSRARDLNKDEVPHEIIEILKEVILYIEINALGPNFFQNASLKELKEVPGGLLAPRLT
jgi:hypothetical protein